MAVTLDGFTSYVGLTSADERYSQAQGVLDAAVRLVRSSVGDRGGAPTYTVRPSGRTLVLPVTQVSSVLSITDPTSTAVTLADCNIDLAAGVVVLPSVTKSSSGYQDAYTVSVYLGDDAAVDEATLIIAKHLWETRRGRSGREQVFAAGEDVPVGFAMPRRATELLATIETPGFA